jgi:hypothetical protein
VWYQFTPGATKEFYMDTYGSDYDTVISVWAGTRGSLTEIDCNDDSVVRGNTRQSYLATTLNAGTTYLINISQYSGILPAELSASAKTTKSKPDVSSLSGGQLKFHITTFYDVPGDFNHWRWIEGFYGAGITTGCGAGPFRYCPTQAVTRADMSVFILRAIHGAGYVPPAATGIFSDVPATNPKQAWIEQFYREGITTGCGADPLRYCPDQPVTRADMSVFILRAIHGATYVPPTATGVFSDVPGTSSKQPWIEQFYHEGITTGCGADPLRYCPDQSVTRADMAVFISRAYSITQKP